MYRAIDIPTYVRNFASQLPCPVSGVHIQTKNWSTNRNVFILLWGVLPVALLSYIS